jgi:hypothetical protein
MRYLSEWMRERILPVMRYLIFVSFVAHSAGCADPSAGVLSRHARTETDPGHCEWFGDEG